MPVWLGIQSVFHSSLEVKKKCNIIFKYSFSLEHNENKGFKFGFVLYPKVHIRKTSPVKHSFWAREMPNG